MQLHPQSSLFQEAGQEILCKSVFSCEEVDASLLLWWWHGQIDT